MRHSINDQYRVWAAAAFLFVTATATQAQQPTKIPMIGVLHPNTAALFKPRHDAFRQGLRELGYVEGKNIIIKYRYAGGERERYRNLAAEIVALKPAVIVVATSAVADAVKQATQTIPIIVANAGDLLGTGIVASLARPGGNVTGVTGIAPDLSGKRLELLKEAMPKAVLIAVLWHSLAPSDKNEVEATEIAAKGLKLKVHVVPVRVTEEFQDAYAGIKRAHADGLIVVASAFTNLHRKSLLDLAVKNRLPSMCERWDLVADGCLMSYGPDPDYQWKRAAAFVDKILKGARPADLPVEQPTKFELVINLGTAKQIGLPIPPHVLARANRVIR